MRLNIPQLLFTSLFVATIVTFSNSMINWEHQIFAGIFAGIITIIGALIAKFIIRDKA